jgi:hypothetical protein
MSDLTPSKLWMSLPADVRLLAARSYDWKSPESRLEAELTIARALKFRDVFVHKLPLEKRIGYLAQAVRPADSLAASLLLALHLEHRRPILGTFLDVLGIKHDNGLITDDNEVEPPSSEALREAAAKLYEIYPREEVTLYLNSLLAVDPVTWGGLRGAVPANAAGTRA